MMNIVEVKELTRVYRGRKVVDNISFEIKRGEVFGLLGPNGAGKTTTISMLTCLIPPTSGNALIEGKSIIEEPIEVKKKIGVVPQDIALYPSLSARENLFFWGEMYGLNGRRLKEKVDEVLQVVGLTERSKDRIDKYSGGMKRRINIAVGLLPSPKLLILDEPTVGLDPQSRTNILESLKELNKDGLTILYTSHYMEEVEFLCDRVAVMDLGKIIAQGTQNELRLLAGKMDSLKIATIDEMPKSLGEIIRKVSETDEVKIADRTVEILTLQGRKVLPKIIEALGNNGIRIKSVEVEEPNLESLFLHLTGKELRD